MPQACYRELHRYKYQLMEDYEDAIGLTGHLVHHDGYYDLNAEGRLTIYRGYAWDGPSGPTIDTPNFMRGSLVHDCLYQMMRRSELPLTLRGLADDLIRQRCREDGMSAFRAGYVHWILRRFGERYARPTSKPDDVVICVP